MSAYTVRVRRDGHFLLFDVPELDLLGQTRTVAAAETTARELIALWLDVPIDTVEATMDYRQLAPAASEAMAVARAERALADEHERTAAREWRRAATTLRNAGLSVRDVATVLGVGAARVQQLVGPKTKAPTNDEAA